MKTKKIVQTQESNIAKIALGTVGVLMIPVVGRWPWGVLDFVTMGVIIFGTGCVLDWLVKNVEPKYRLFAILAVLLLFFLIWAQLAVGLISQLIAGETWIQNMTCKINYE